MMSAPPLRTRTTRRIGIGLILCVLSGLHGGVLLAAQEPNAPQAVTADQLKAAIDKLGDFDYLNQNAKDMLHQLLWWTDALKTARENALSRAA